MVLDNLEDLGCGAVVAAEAAARLGRRACCSPRGGAFGPATWGSHSLALETFARPESVRFLQKFCPDEGEDALLGDLADKLGDLPLALELAGRYIESHGGLPVRDYLAELADARAAVDHESFTGYGHRRHRTHRARPGPARQLST